jgi:hypothetical protein
MEAEAQPLVANHRGAVTVNSIEENYRGATEKSAQLAKRAERVMPGGDTRTTTYYRPYPLTIKRGEGPFLWDVDGNKYVDLLGNYTSLVHGNAYPPVVEAVTRAVRDGSSWGARSEARRRRSIWRRCCASAWNLSTACDFAIRERKPGCSRRMSRGASPAAS